MPIQKSPEQLHSHIVAFHKHVKPDSTADPSTLDLLALLNDLCGIEFPSKNISDQQAIEILVESCKCIPWNSKYCSALCKFMFKLLSKQIRLSSIRLSQMETLMTYLLDGIEQTHETSSDVRFDMLRALSALVFENASSTAKFYPRVARILLALADQATSPLEVRRMAINCIGNTCAGAGTKLNAYYKDYYKVLLSNLSPLLSTSSGSSIAPCLSDSAVRKVASSTLRSLQFVLAQDKSLVEDPMFDIIPVIRTFIFMGVSVQAYMAVQASIDRSNNGQDEISSSRSQPLHNSARMRNAQWQPQFLWRSQKSTAITSSDSELSDSPDATVSNPRRQRDEAKIRINALLCLTAIAKTSPRRLYSFWHKFIPDTFSVFLSNNTNENDQLLPTLQSDNQPLSLFTMLLYDPMPTVRTAVCNALTSMLDGSQQYLSVASESDSKSSFTTLSERVASILRDFHSGILYALEKEQNSQVLIAIMKVTSTLVANCSYERMAPGYLPQLYKRVMSRGVHAPAILQTAVLHVIGSILEAKADRKEVTDLVTRPVLLDSGETLPALASVLVNSLESIRGMSTDLSAATWQALGLLSKFHFTDIHNRWDDLQDSFDGALKDKDAGIRTAALKFAEMYASSMQDLLLPVLDQCTIWWGMMLSKYIQASCVDSSPAVRSMSCNCLASLTKEIFEKLSLRYQRLAVTLLLPLSSDDDASVRATACRALGVFVHFPVLREDPLFISDMAVAVLQQMNDKAILVQMRAGWALGNLCDSLVLESESPEFSTQEWVSAPVWRNIVTATTAASMDNDKLRSNAVRALGSLLRITPKAYFEPRPSQQLIKEAMKGLVKNIETGSLKTRWNACHAASNMLRNKDFPIGAGYPWTTAVYGSLINSLTQCRNYKVRINACLALAMPSRKEQYGDKSQFLTVLKGVQDAWKSCNEDGEEDYQQYQYKEQLKQQVATSLEHLQHLDRLGEDE